MIPSTLMPESDKALLNILPWRWLFTLLRSHPQNLAVYRGLNRPSAATDCAWELASTTRNWYRVRVPLAVEPLPLYLIEVRHQIAHDSSITNISGSLDVSLAKYCNGLFIPQLSRFTHRPLLAAH